LVVCITHISGGSQEHTLRAMLYVVGLFALLSDQLFLCYKKLSIS